MGRDVIVQTVDPFGSNRVLKGKLIDRNALDVIIEKAEQMVTIPQSMISYVRVRSRVFIVYFRFPFFPLTLCRISFLVLFLQIIFGYGLDENLHDCRSIYLSYILRDFFNFL